MNKNPIFCAIDTSDIEIATNLISKLKPHIGGIKLGLEFFTSCGISGCHTLKEFGLPVAGVIALGWYVKTQNAWIQNELQTELRESFTRLEGILIKLIDDQKQMQLNQEDIKASYHAIVEILASLSGNGLKEKFVKKRRDY